MKLYILLIFLFIFISCSAKPKTNQSADEVNAIIEKNKQTAVLSEVSALTRTAQRLERLGREMDSYRRAPDAENQRICNKLMEDARAEVTDLETKINNLPQTYNAQLTPIIGELNECVSCSKKAMDGCRKARAFINEVIGQIFPK